MRKRIIDKVIRVEGGYVNDPSDSGGETNFGITIEAARAYGYAGDMLDLPREIAFDIYSARYWDAVSADDLATISEDLAEEIVDTAVNMGQGRAGKFLQRTLNVFNRRGELYGDTSVDGDIGPGTLETVRCYARCRDIGVLVKALNSLQGAFYIELAERREKDEEFAYGWVKERVKL